MRYGDCFINMSTVQFAKDVGQYKNSQKQRSELILASFRNIYGSCSDQKTTVYYFRRKFLFSNTSYVEIYVGVELSAHIITGKSYQPHRNSFRQKPYHNY